MFNSIRYSDELKAQTLVHETIHSVTVWAMSLYDNPSTRVMLNGEQQRACRDITQVFAALSGDPMVRANLRARKD